MEILNWGVTLTDVWEKDKKYKQQTIIKESVCL